MKVGLVAVHYPRDGERANLLARVQHAVDVIRSTSGCLGADCWWTAARDAVVSTGQWESRAAMNASFAAARADGVDFDYDARESRPRQVFRLESTETER